MTNKQPSPPNKTLNALLELGRHLGKVVVHNWPMKLACMLMAILLWGTLITRDDTLTRTKVFENVTISVVNQNTMLRNGYIVTGGLEHLSDVRVTAEVPQKYYDTAGSSSYNIRIDLSLIDQTGEVKVPVQHTRHSLFGDVTDLSVEEVTLRVEEYLTRSRIPVKIRVVGEMPEGLYGSASNIMVDPEYVTIAGPRSKVLNVIRCVALYDLSTLSGDAGLERTACSFVLEDAAGRQVNMENVSVMLNSSELDSIIAEQTLYRTVTMELEPFALLKGNVADGYRIKNVTVSPENIVMAVRDVTSFTGDLKYLDGAVDVSGLTESKTSVLTIIRPGDVINMNSDVAYVTVEVEKIEEAEGTE